MYDYRLFEALAAVVEQKGFSRAAERLYLTSSAVSQRIRAFEEQIGQPLLVRSTPPRLTAVGKRYYRHYVQVRSLESTLRGPADGGEPPTLSIAVDRDSLEGWFAAAVVDCLATAQFLLEVIPAHEDMTQSYLADGRVFGCLTSSASPPHGCTSRRLGAVDYLCVAAPSLRDALVAAGKRARLAFDRSPILAYDAGDRLHARWLADQKVDAGDVRAHIVPNHQLYYALLCAGAGYGLIPASEAKPYLAAHTLVELVPGAGVSIDLHWQSWELQTGAMQALSAAIVARARASLRTATIRS